MLNLPVEYSFMLLKLLLRRLFYYCPRALLAGNIRKNSLILRTETDWFVIFFNGFWQILSKFSVNDLAYLYAKVYSYNRSFNCQSKVCLSINTFFTYYLCFLFWKVSEKCFWLHKNSQCKSVNIFMKQIETTEKLYIFFILCSTILFLTIAWSIYIPALNVSYLHWINACS